MWHLYKGLHMSIAKLASASVDAVYPVIQTGKPHHMTRKKQRIAWQLGYIKGYEEARKAQLYKHIGNNDGHAETKKPTKVP